MKNRKQLKTYIILVFFLVLYIAPVILPLSLTIPDRQNGPNMTKDFSLSASSWYNSEWHYRVSIPITGSVGAGTDYQICLTVPWDANIQSDFDDLRFTASDNVTLLPHWIESFIPIKYALVWVKVSDDLGTDQKITMYYGNGGVSDGSNGTATFLFFDDFNDDVLDSTNWHEIPGLTSGTPTESGGDLVYTNPSGWGSWATYEQWSDNVAMGSRVKFSAESNNIWHGFDERSFDGTSAGSGVDQITIAYDGSKLYGLNSDGTTHNTVRATFYTSYVVSELQWTDDVEYYEEHSLAETISYDCVNDMGITMLTLNAHTFNLDWVYVRNCIDEEPVVGAFGTEENNLEISSWPVGNWTRNVEPILTETDGTNEPQVLYDTNPQILTNETYVWKMWYRVGWIPVSIYYAESTDGITWTKYDSNPVLNETGNHYCPFVLKYDSVYYMFAGYGPWEGDTLYNSSNGISWSIMNGGDPVIAISAGDAWDNNSIGNIAVWVNGSGVWNMIYESFGDNGLWKLGLATSSNGTTWTKYANNPVLQLVGSCGGPSIVYLSGIYHMFFHGVSEYASLPIEIYMATSTDLIHWTEPEHIFPRMYAWEGVGSGVGQVADPDVIIVDGQIIMYYAGVDAQSLGHQYIGYARIISLSEIYQTAFIPWTILLGLVLIPFSAIFLVHGGRENASMDKMFYFLIMFIIGWALVIGGIMT